MTNYRLFTWILLCTLLIALMQCKKKSSTVSPDPRAKLSIEDLKNLTFKWEEDESTPKKIIGNKKLRIYELLEYNSSDSGRQIVYKKLDEINVEGINEIRLSPETRQLIQSKNVLAWEVISQNDQQTNTIKPISVFALGDIPEFAAALFVPQGPHDPMTYCTDTLYVGEQCDSMKIITYQCGGPIIHIVNIEDAVFSDGITARLGSYDPESKCIEGNPSTVSCYLEFKVEVPCHKRNLLNDSQFELMVFKNGNTISSSEITFTDLSINDHSVNDVSQFVISPPDDYIHYCEGNTPRCEALVRVHMSIEVEYQQEMPLPYNIVFYLLPDAIHPDEGMPVDTLQQDELNLLKRSTQTHSIADCANDHQVGTYAYYQCIDNLTGQHVADHIIDIAIPFCNAQSE